MTYPYLSVKYMVIQSTRNSFDAHRIVVKAIGVGLRYDFPESRFHDVWELGKLFE